MEQSKQDICQPLPGNITKRISTCENSEQYITNFLQNVLPSSDTKSIADELRKTIILRKRKSKRRQTPTRSDKLLTARKRTELGLRRIVYKHGMKYKDVLPLNQLWQKYMQDMLGNKFFENIPRDPTDPNWEAVNQQLIKADFHGAKITVVRAKCPSLVGLGGIVIQETKNIFRVCAKDDIVRTIPKSVTVLDIYLGKVTLQLFGKELCMKPIERTVKKFKNARAFDL